MGKILILHGPNLNMLGTREPDIYGTDDLVSLNQHLLETATNAGHALESFQSNAEHELVTRIQQAKTDNIDFIIINPAAFTHTSIALRDALLAVDTPFIEVHLSNIFTREAFRQHSYFSDIAIGMISGLGTQGYNLALQAAFSQIKLKTG